MMSFLKKKLRLLLTTIILTMLVQSAFADSTNNNLKRLSVLGDYLGGVGLSCVSVQNDNTFIKRLFLLTRDRNVLGEARFSDDDVSYRKYALLSKTPDWLLFGRKKMHVHIQRKTLRLETNNGHKRQIYSCSGTDIFTLHKAAEADLRNLLQGNKI